MNHEIIACFLSLVPFWVQEFRYDSIFTHLHSISTVPISKKVDKSWPFWGCNLWMIILPSHSISFSFSFSFLLFVLSSIIPFLPPLCFRLIEPFLPIQSHETWKQDGRGLFGGLVKQLPLVSEGSDPPPFELLITNSEEKHLCINSYLDIFFTLAIHQLEGWHFVCMLLVHPSHTSQLAKQPTAKSGSSCFYWIIFLKSSSYMWLTKTVLEQINLPALRL